MSTLVITGAAGYIGSLLCNTLADLGERVIALDNLSSGHRAFLGDLEFYNIDIGDKNALTEIIKSLGHVDCLIHMAALIDAAESVYRPLEYYDNNLSRAIRLIEVCLQCNIRSFIFSSTAAVYGEQYQENGIVEDVKTAPASPYAYSKNMFELILRDLVVAHPIRALILRYFNPIGADPKLRSGPYRSDSGHILGRLIQQSSCLHPEFTIYGTDYPTRDGTAIRDYIHVQDLVDAHITALQYVLKLPGNTCDIFNIGNGKGTTVREFVAAFERVVGRDIRLILASRRPGDIAGGYANVDKVRDILGWSARYNIEDGIRHALEWQDVFLGYRKSSVMEMK